MLKSKENVQTLSLINSKIENKHGCSPQRVFGILSVVLLSQRSGQEEDDPGRHHQETGHGGDGDADHQRLGDVLLAVLAAVPPVLSNTTPAAHVTSSTPKNTARVSWSPTRLHFRSSSI